jgi:hypothetical protein
MRLAARGAGAAAGGAGRRIQIGTEGPELGRDQNNPPPTQSGHREMPQGVNTGHQPGRSQVFILAFRTRTVFVQGKGAFAEEEQGSRCEEER